MFAGDRFVILFFVLKKADIRQEYQMIRSFLLYFFIYCPLGVLCPLIGQYLSSIGFSGTQVGTVTSLGTAAAVLGGMFWGKVYANAYRKKCVIIIMFLGAAVMSVAGLSTNIFIIYAMIYSAMYFFQGPVHGLCDSMVMEGKNNFAAVRAAGALGYALAVCLAGQYAQSHGLSIIFYIYSAAFIIASLIMRGIKEPACYSSPDKKIKASELFRNKKYVKLLICSFFLMGTNVGNSTYFGYLFREGGGSLGGIGLAFLLMAGSEAPFMFLIPVLNRKFSSEKLLYFAIGVCTLRFAFYAAGHFRQLDYITTLSSACQASFFVFSTNFYAPDQTLFSSLYKPIAPYIMNAVKFHIAKKKYTPPAPKASSIIPPIKLHTIVLRLFPTA